MVPFVGRSGKKPLSCCLFLPLLLPSDLLPDIHTISNCNYHTVCKVHIQNIAHMTCTCTTHPTRPLNRSFNFVSRSMNEHQCHSDACIICCLCMCLRPANERNRSWMFVNKHWYKYIRSCARTHAHASTRAHIFNPHQLPIEMNQFWMIFFPFHKISYSLH